MFFSLKSKVFQKSYVFETKIICLNNTSAKSNFEVVQNQTRTINKDTKTVLSQNSYFDLNISTLYIAHKFLFEIFIAHLGNSFIQTLIFAFHSSQTVKLDTADGETIEVDIKVANVSGTISGLLEMFEVAETDEEFNIPLQNVNARILRLVLEWAEEHKHDPIVEGDLKNKDIPAWDAEFLGKMEKGA